VWLIGAGFALARLSCSRRRLLTRMPRRALASREVAQHMAQLMRSEAATSLPRVSESACLSSPIALSRSEICIPEGSWRRLSRGQLRSLLAHELAHVRE
jgi:beta-lactamase regulating signal transducer with metallopeptidase domain